MNDINAVDLSRMQFGITTIYHFLLPLSIGLVAFVALCQTLAYLAGRELPSPIRTKAQAFAVVRREPVVTSGVAPRQPFRPARCP
ncbi:MAG: Cytochrome bd terminal oxidase subunit [Solirubrobacterales bacterium]|nr:Cytochrome bd terminal oxidase subunit [Solirubrobacterales bacterium]